MKKFLVFSLLFIFFGCYSWNVSAAVATSSEGEEQEYAFKKEHKIFLWDVTVSMVGATENPNCPKATKRTKPDFDYQHNGSTWNYNKDKDIFDKTREDLIRLIMNINTESTKITVIPFRDDIIKEDIFVAEMATAEGKAELKRQILEWNGLKNGVTNTATCLKKAVERFEQDRRNQVILLTDGEPYKAESEQLLTFIKNWRNYKETRASGNNLVYVMLTDEANGTIGPKIKELSNQDPEHITVLDQNSNIVEHAFVTIGNHASIHVRDFFDGKVSRDGKGKIEIACHLVGGPAIPSDAVFHFKLDENDFVSVDPTIPIHPIGEKIEIPFTLLKTFEGNLATLPADYDATITGNIELDATSKNIDIQGNRGVTISLVMKPEPRVTISWSTK